MQFILGLLTAVVFFLCLAFAFYLGTRQNNRKTNQPTDKEEVRKMEQIHTDFMKLMNYNEDIARQRKKVT